MYLHLGQNVTAAARSVVGVFDLDNASASKHTRAFLERAQVGGSVIGVSDELPRSFVVCVSPSGRTGGMARRARRYGERAGDERVFLSQISSRTLLRRADVAGLE